MTDSTGLRLACLIIDDPVLRPEYGCLNYELLLQAMRDHDFFTEIAFIPWNYGRSDPRTVRLFRDNPDRFALCVHGCNHSAGEFAGNDQEWLSALSATALWRMEEHRRLTGLAYDPVFIFPQGLFSSAAVQALKGQGFYAACNTSIRPIDRDEPPSCEYRKPATMLYHDFPLFLRHYPEDRHLFIKDFESNRPIIIAQHHGNFRDGYRKITDFVDWINGFGEIQWTSLLRIAQFYTGREHSSKIVPVNANFSRKVRTRAALRRHLCEFRDNYVEKSSSLAGLYGWSRSLLHRF